MTDGMVAQASNSSKADTIHLLRHRAAGARKLSIAVLALILVVLITGFAVFILAGTIVTRQGAQQLASAQLTYRRLQADSVTTAQLLSVADSVVAGMASARRRIDSLVRRQDTVEARWRAVSESVMAVIRTARRGGLEPPGPFPLPERSNLNAVDTYRPLDSVFKGVDTAKQHHLRRSLDSIAARIQDVRPSIDQGLRSGFTASEITTRIGAVVILLFLVQILVPLYRYSTRLAYFLDARADILALLPATPLTVEQLTAVLAPEAIDFGRAPRTPTQEAVDIAKQIVASGMQRST